MSAKIDKLCQGESPTIVTRVPPDIHAALVALAAARRVKLAVVIRQIIYDGLGIKYPEDT